MPEQPGGRPPKVDKPKILDLATGDPMGEVNRQLEDYNNQVRGAIRAFFQPINNVLEYLNKLVNGTATAAPAPVQDAPVTAPPPAQPVGWSDMLQLNILFADNSETPFYTLQQTMGTGVMSKMQEQLATNAALEAIRECAIYTEEFPPPTQGPYAGRPIKELVETVTPDDLQEYLRFVKAYPAKYVGKTWKISETYTTWLINNSPSA